MWKLKAKSSWLDDAVASGVGWVVRDSLVCLPSLLVVYACRVKVACKPFRRFCSCQRARVPIVSVYANLLLYVYVDLDFRYKLTYVNYCFNEFLEEDSEKNRRIRLNKHFVDCV